MWYLFFNILGFVIVFISVLFINKKYKKLSLEYLIYSYIIFLIGFILFAKLFNIVFCHNLSNIFSGNIIDRLKFLFSGYAFIGGYVGVLIALYLFGKVIKKDSYDLFKVYLPSMFIMYSLMKIGCYIKGCCIGINGFPIQIVESFIAMVWYIIMLILIKRDNKYITEYSLVIFGLSRFVVTFFREYQGLFSFILNLVISLVIAFLGRRMFLRDTSR